MRSTADNFAAGSTPPVVDYTYDNAGNRLTAGDDAFTYDVRNRLMSDPDGTYAWNPDGTLDEYTPTVGAAEDYTFDAGGRIAEITDGTDTTTYSYDQLDRIAERNSTPFTYRGLSTDPVDDGTNTYTRSAGGGLVTHNDDVGVITFPVTDLHGDLVGLIDAGGVLSDSAQFDPFGEPLATSGTTDVLLGYQSDWTDPTTEHVWMAARWYQPSSGTFLSRDTYFGELATPFSLNRYTYALNNPINFWDPTGRNGQPNDPTPATVVITTIVIVPGTSGVDVIVDPSGTWGTRPSPSTPGTKEGYGWTPPVTPAPTINTDPAAFQADIAAIVNPQILLAEFLNNVRIMDAAAALVNGEFDISATGACRDSWYSSVAERATQNMLGFFCGAADNVLDVGQMVLGMGWATMNCTALLASFGEHGSCKDAKGIAAGVAQLGQAIANCQVGLCDDAAAIVGTMATDIYNRCKEFGYDNCAGYLAVDVADLVVGSHGVGKLDDALDLATVANRLDDANDVARVLDDVPGPVSGPPSSTFRADTRSPSQIFDEGFQPVGDDLDLLGHAEGYPNSGYVATSKSPAVAEGWGAPYVYEVQAPGGIDVNDALGPMSPYPSEFEVAFPGGVEPSCILGCTMPNGDWVPNLNFWSP